MGGEFGIVLLVIGFLFGMAAAATTIRRSKKRGFALMPDPASTTCSGAARAKDMRLRDEGDL
jgi:hypothetical protein